MLRAVLTFIANRHARRAITWWLAVRFSYRLLLVAAAGLKTAGARDDFPPYARKRVLDLARRLEADVRLWRELVEQHCESPLLCPICSAPRSHFDGGPCPRCPKGDDPCSSSN